MSVRLAGLSVTEDKGDKGTTINPFYTLDHFVYRTIRTVRLILH